MYDRYDDSIISIEELPIQKLIKGLRDISEHFLEDIMSYDVVPGLPNTTL